jgi:4-hydroxybenzoate polyprenyltransferase
MLYSILKLIRVHQWVKNGFVFAPVFFASRLNQGGVWLQVTIAFFAFSVMASCIYVINDYVDIERDRLHPSKCKRPLAAGTITKPQAKWLIISLLAVAVALSITLPFPAILIVLGYFVMNLFYSFKLKHIAIIDITIIAIGFLLRIFLGGVTTQVLISHWLIMLTFLLAMFLGLAKRRDEYLIYLQGKSTRTSIEGYNIDFINVAMMLTASVTVVTYIMYTVSDEVTQRIGHSDLYITTIFVVLGILRYLQQTLVFTQSASPTKILLHDHFLQGIIGAWLMTFGYFLYV